MNGPVTRGGIRVRARLRMMAPLARMTNPMILKVHGNPIRYRSCLAIMVKTMPPVTKPFAIPDIANARFFKKYVDINVTVGQNTRPSPKPTQIPWARKSCQY